MPWYQPNNSRRYTHVNRHPLSLSNVVVNTHQRQLAYRTQMAGAICSTQQILSEMCLEPHRKVAWVCGAPAPEERSGAPEGARRQSPHPVLSSLLYHTGHNTQQSPCELLFGPSSSNFCRLDKFKELAKPINYYYIPCL